MSEPAMLKCLNNASFKQIYILKLFIAFKRHILAVSAKGGNLEILDFLQYCFITLTTTEATLYSYRTSILNTFSPISDALVYSEYFFQHYTNDSTLTSIDE